MSCSRIRARSGGFTLVEVLVALAIIAMVTVVLLARRVEIVRDASKTRDMRTAWTLAAQKMGELELDPTVFVEEGSGSTGDFREYGQEYADFAFAWEVKIEDVPTNDPADANDLPNRIFRLKLTVQSPSAETPDDHLVLEALYPVPKEEKK